MTDIIKIEHLNKSFVDVKAVNDLSFRVKKCELFAFLGVNGAVAAQLAAAPIAVSCDTVTFCVNLTMVQDRANGTRRDFDVSPVSRSKIYIGYFLSKVVNSLMVNSFALVLCLLYVLKMGWYMSCLDIILVIVDMVILVLFGSTLSSIISYPLKTQGKLSMCK